jgi:hypothetical protein
MSTITSVVFVTKIEIAPPLPAGTMAALATILPSNEFKVDTFGCVEPAGHAVRYWSGPCGTTVMFSE